MLNVHIYPSTFEYETRILKVTRVLVEEKLVDNVLIIARAGHGLPKEANIDARRKVCRIDSCLEGDGFLRKILRFVEWSLRVFARLRHEPVKMINCHSLSVLPLCVAIKLWHRAILVYEPHELETETATFSGFPKKLAKIVERLFIGQAARVIVVSKSISQYYRQDYDLRDVPVIMNVPEITDGDEPVRNSLLRDYFDIPEGHLVFMYQGALEEERGIVQLLEAFRKVPPDRHIVFMGFGELEKQIQEAVVGNIHLHPAVAPDMVLQYTNGVDIGFALLDANCLNHQCALPNKLFHYIHAGLPVIVSNLVEMGALVEHYHCGWRVDNSTEALSSRVKTITLEDMECARKGALMARKELHWKNEADKLVTIYRELLPVTI